MPSESLVQILPPLRQSMVETAACPRAYAEIYINGKVQPDSIPSERGSDIHRVMSRYVDYCVRERTESDWIKFNELASAAGPVAGPILDGLRDSYEVDWQHVYGTEITLRLAEDFEPCAPPVEMAVQKYRLHEEDAAYEGTLDAILLSNDGTRAKIVDYKSHPAVFEADSFQSTLYPFMLFKHLPDLETITFELVFVRYTNCVRTVTWKRTDMPEMQATISRARERQRITHENPDDALALPCKSCTYCPLAKNLTCPIADWNEYTTLSNSDRLRAIEFYRRMRSLHMPVLKAHAEVNGPISYRDGNGRVYEYGPQEVPSTRYPLDRTTIQVLDDYSAATGESWESWNLDISSTALKAKLKAKKRTTLREVFEESLIETSTKPKFAVRTPDEGVINEYQHDEEE